MSDKYVPDILAREAAQRLRTVHAPELSKVDRPQEPRMESPGQMINRLTEERDEARARCRRMEGFLSRIVAHWKDWPDNEGLEVVLGPPADEDGEAGEGRCDFTLGQLRRAVDHQQEVTAP